MTYDVVIAGGGPVGLFLACELRLAGISVLVLEKLQDTRTRSNPTTRADAGSTCPPSKPSTAADCSRLCAKQPSAGSILRAEEAWKSPRPKGRTFPPFPDSPDTSPESSSTPTI
ncbi:MAG: FAD-dependent monooxygenase [Alloacidobacterium sp.]